MNQRQSTPTVRRLRIAGLVLLVCLAYVLVVLALPQFWVFVVNQILITALGALGLNLLTGYAGLVSVGNAAFLAIGGYVAIAVAPEVGLLGALVAGAVACGVVGTLVGLPALRLSGIYLAISTLALQYIVVFGFQKLQSSDHATSGYAIGYPSLGPLTFDTDLKWAFLLGICTLIAVYVSTCLVRGRPGRAWVAVREHDVAAAMAGIDVRRYKLLAFLVSSMMIGASGVLRTYYSGHMGYEEFTLDLSVAYVAMIIVGGLGSIAGALIGAALVTGLPYVVQNVATNSFQADSSGFLLVHLSLINVLIYGVIVLLFLAFEPRGLVALFTRLGRWLRKHVGRDGPPEADAAGPTPPRRSPERVV